MSVEENKALVRRYLDLYRTGDPRIADEIIDVQFVDHAHPEQRPGPEDVKRMVSRVQSAFSDIAITTEDVIGEGDRVACRFTLAGVHSATFAGIPPTGRRFTLTGIDFLRIANGKLVELWSALDTLSLLQQLGAIVEIAD
jgi:steroid delta-isomerase-like uncharacterized protein